MSKKSHASSLQERQPKASKKPTMSTEELQAELNALMAMPENGIDLSDIPELNFDKLGKPLVGKFYRPIKKPISIRMDADVLNWFKAHSHYQRLINTACRLYMLRHREK